MKLALAALAIVLVSALICIGVIKISHGKEIESFEIGFHIRLNSNDVLKGVDMHTIKEDPKSWFPVKRRKDMQATIADSAHDPKYWTGHLDSSKRDEQRKRELYIERDTLHIDSSEFHKINEK